MLLDIRPLHPRLGAEVTGIDLSQSLPGGVLEALRSAWAQYGLLLFRGQEISEVQQIAFGQQFGNIDTRSRGNVRSSSYKILMDASNVSEEGRLVDATSPQAQYSLLNGYWHIDRSYRKLPSLGTMLHGVEIPVGSGDTLFANLKTAYREMPPDLKARVRDRRAVHSFERGLEYVELPQLTEAELTEMPPIEQPLERLHPDGSISLFLSPLYTARVLELPADESDALLRDLTSWASQEQFVYRHQWQPHDLVFWDNRWTMHKVDRYDFVNQRRRMHRMVLNGTDPVRAPASARTER